MKALVALSRAIDGLTIAIGRAVSWLVLAAILVSAGNALVRKLLDTSSNAWLELQWWMFGAVFLLAAPWTLRSNEHIRIDVVSQRFSERTRALIDIVGHALFLIPVTAVVLVTSWPFFLRAFIQNEQSANAGGPVQWPAKLLIPAAFTLLLLQGVSELVKRFASLGGRSVAGDPMGSVGGEEPAARHPAHEMGAAVDRADRDR